jgi:hypothetical protein
MKMHAVSMRRHNAGIRAKRAYGSSTATLFLVGGHGASVWVEAYGPTPGERKTYAVHRAECALPCELNGNSEHNPLKAYPPVHQEVK